MALATFSCAGAQFTLENLSEILLVLCARK